MLVADAFEKVRIKPGNLADGRKAFEEITYDDPATFRAEQEVIREVSTGQFHSNSQVRACLREQGMLGQRLYVRCSMPSSTSFTASSSLCIIVVDTLVQSVTPDERITNWWHKTPCCAERLVFAEAMTHAQRH